MATDLDSLQISIESSSQKAEDAINSLVKGLENLNTALGNLDVSKITQFSNAVSKLSNIGANTSGTSKAIKNLANDVSQAFGIKTKKGINEIRSAIEGLYNATKNDGVDYMTFFSGVEQAIKDNYRLKTTVDSTTKSIRDYVNATNKSGTKVGMADMHKEFGENFKEMSAVLGSAFKNNLSSTQAGVQDLAEYLNEMNAALGTDFDATNVEKGLAQLVESLKHAKDATLDYNEARTQGRISDDDVWRAADRVADALGHMYKEQEKYGATSGLSGVASFFQQIGDLNLPDMSGMASAIKEVGNNPPVQTAKAVEDIGRAASVVAQKAQEASIALDGAFNSKKRILGADANAGNYKVTEFGFTSDIQGLESVDYAFKEVKADAEKLLPAVITVKDNLKQLFEADLGMSNTSQIINAVTQSMQTFALAVVKTAETSLQLATNMEKMLPTLGSISQFQPPDLYTAVVQFTALGKAAEYAFEQMKRIGMASENMSGRTTPLLGTDPYIDTSGEWVDDNTFQGAAAAAEEASEAIKEATGAAQDFQEEVEKKPTANMADVLQNVVELGNALGEVSEKFNGIAEKGIGLFKILTKPLQMASEEYVEKFKGMGETIANFRKNFNAQMAKMSQFWKRTMKTFTFMLVRKAITAIIKEVGNAVQSLAMYSNAMGTAFNRDLSLMVADFQYLGRSIVSVFAPLLSYIAPIIDAIVDKIAVLISYIGMLIAALGGSTSFTKAKKNVGNYAESLDQASKSAKNLTMGIDELNILSEGGGGGSAKPYDGWEDAWEQVKIPDWIQNLAKTLKDMFAQLLEPLKKAWEAMKEYFKSAFNYMKQELIKLAKSIWKAFIEVWNEDATVEIFKNIIGAVADIMITIGNLAKNFREAWDEVVNGASRGVQIFRGIRDIFGILVQHVRNVTLYMSIWSSQINFAPLLDGVIGLLDALKPLADFLGGVFEDVMKNVVLEYIRFMIEEGLPHLMHGIEEILGAFDFTKLRSQLQPLETSFIQMYERIDKGMVNAFTNIGKAIGEFSQSENFQAFLDNIQHLMDSISQEDVQKILEGIGLGLLHISEALVNFVGSDTFKVFVDLLNEWLDSKSAEDIAGILEKIAWAIGLFKFAAFATEGMAGFFKFAAVIVSLTNLHTIATSLASAAGASTAAAGGFAAFGTAAATVVGVIAGVIAAVYSLTASFGGLGGLILRIKEAFDRVKETFRLVAEALNMDERINTLKEKFQGLTDKLAHMQSFWNILLYLVEGLAHVFAVLLAPAIDMIVTGFTAVIEIISGVIDIIGGLADAVMGLIEGITTGNWDGLKNSFARMGEGLWEVFIDPVGTMADSAKDAIVGTAKGIGSLFSDEVETDIKSADWEKIPEDAQIGQKIVNGTVTSYQNAASSTESVMKETTKGLFNNGLNVAGEIDYKTPVATTSQHLMEEFYSSAQSADWATYGTIVNSEAGNSITSQSQPFTDANTATALEGATAFGTEYANYFSSNTDMGAALGEFGRTSGLELANGFNESLDQNISTTQSVLTGWFMKIQSVISEQMNQVKLLFEKLMSNAISNANVAPAVSMLFTNLATAIDTNLNLMGNMLTSTTLPTFMTTYLLPFFSLERWQPLFDNLMNTVFVPMFELFRTWFTNDAMTPWWNDDLMFWFTADKWNEDIFNPLHETIQENWDTFSGWWDTSMTSWWENQVEVWFSKEIWTGVLTNVLDAAEAVFELVRLAIKEKIEKAQEAVEDAVEEMKNAIAEILDLIDEFLEKLEGLGSLGGNVQITFSGQVGQFANGGFPEAGSLFLAGEAGAEFVTNVGGRTGVVSNNEITGIADAVYTTSGQESQLLSELIQLGRQMLDKDPVVIGDREIAKLATSGRNKLGMSIIN